MKIHLTNKIKLQLFVHVAVHKNQTNDSFVSLFVSRCPYFQKIPKVVSPLCTITVV